MGVTHHTSMKATGTVQASGPVIATGTGKNSKLNAVEVTATTLLGNKVRVASAANCPAGIKTIVAASAGSGVVSNTLVRASSRILISPVGPTANYSNLQAWISTIASGASFTIKLDRVKTAGTQATASGRVSYLIINK